MSSERCAAATSLTIGASLVKGNTENVTLELGRCVVESDSATFASLVKRRSYFGLLRKVSQQSRHSQNVLQTRRRIERLLYHLVVGVMSSHRCGAATLLTIAASLATGHTVMDSARVASLVKRPAYFGILRRVSPHSRRWQNVLQTMRRCRRLLHYLVRLVVGKMSFERCATATSPTAAASQATSHPKNGTLQLDPCAAETDSATFASWV